jgi:hypothetical protein
MSSTTTTSNGVPFQQWQNFYPNGAAGAPGADMPYAYMPYGDTKVQDSVINAERNLTKEVTQSTLGLRDAVERGNLQIVGDVERTAGQAQTTIERVGANGSATTERATGHVNAAVERNGGNIMTAIEKVAGEQRLTTAVSSAANRQAAADSSRDLAIAIERNGANAVDASKDAQTALLGSIERNAGEGRVTTVTAQGFLDAKLTDVRHSILNASNSNTNELIAVNTNNSNVVSKAIHDSAIETRSLMGTGFGSVSNGIAEMKLKSSDQYSQLMLEQQKMGQFLSSKSDNQFAMTQMEMQKCKADLAAQSAQQFSMNQLENQKLGSSISAQLAEAKYDALKNTQELGNKIEKCCCELKEKNDRLERESLRDELIKANSDNNLLKTPYTLGSGILGYPGIGGPGFGPGFGPYGGGFGGYGGYGCGGYGGLGNDVGYGNNVHIHSSERENSPGPIRAGGHGHGHP